MTRLLFSLACVIALFASLSTGTVAGQGSESARTLQLINQARIGAGLAPLALNQQLTAAAQGHADDMARSGVGIGHGGSDGSNPFSRILAAGYRSYSFGLRAGENWAAYQSVDISFTWWMSDSPHRDNILNSYYREIGVGVARDGLGNPILVTDFGAQPNVLPVFAASSAVTLSNEDAAPWGDGPAVIGRATSVDIATNPEFGDAQTFQWARTIPYIPSGGNPSAIFVRFRDTSGRTVVSSAAATPIIAPAGVQTSTSTPTPTRTRTRTPRPSATRTRTASRTPSLVPTDLPTSTATSTPTSTRSATATLTDTPVIHFPVATVSLMAAEATGSPSFDVGPVAGLLLAGAGAFAILAILKAVRARR